MDPPPKRRRKRASTLPKRDVTSRQAAEQAVTTANAETDDGLSNHSPGRPDLHIQAYRASTMPDSLKKWTFDLTKTNMFTLYDKTWGWNARQKRRELYHQHARFLVACSSEKYSVFTRKEKDDIRLPSPLAFIHIRFEIETGDVPGVYVYDLQTSHKHQGKGIGSALMDAVEQIGKSYKMEKCSLTVLKVNRDAKRFYEKRGYKRDEHTPTEETCVYIILSKKL